MNDIAEIALHAGLVILAFKLLYLIDYSFYLKEKYKKK